MIYSLYIVNKAGGLIYQADFNPGLSKLTANEYLVLAGTVHGVFAIASKVTPTALKVGTSSSIGSSTSSSQASNPTLLSNFSKGISTAGFVNPNTSGLKSIETDTFSMFVLQTVTGLKLLLVTAPNNVTGPVNASDGNGLNRSLEVAESVLRRIYTLYADYVLKNPFYSLDMPIRVDLFDQKVSELVQALS